MRPDRARILRVWDVLRTQQLEFLPQLRPGALLYRVEKYDFDPALLDPDSMVRAGPAATVRVVLLGRYEVLETNEPTMVHLWRFLVGYAVALRLNRAARWVLRLLGRAAPRPLSVLYAIDNFDVRRGYQLRGRGPAWLRGIGFDLTFRFLLRGVDRIAFGTSGARDVYLAHAGRAMRDVRTIIVPELDQACGCGPLRDKDPQLLLFVGALDDRKGIVELMAAWPAIAARSPRLRLVVLGKGPYRDRVQAWADGEERVEFVHDPPREQIHGWYRRARAVVLLSQPHPRWREQVGLPITEGLSHGCRILASTQTGVADWLREHGHQVLAPDASPAQIADALTALLSGEPDPGVVLDTLPHESTRVTVDRWLTAPADGH